MKGYSVRVSRHKIRGGKSTGKIHPKQKKEAFEQAVLNNFRWVPDSRHRREGNSSRELFEKSSCKCGVFGISGFWVGFWASAKTSACVSEWKELGPRKDDIIGEPSLPKKLTADTSELITQTGGSIADWSLSLLRTVSLQPNFDHDSLSHVF